MGQNQLKIIQNSIKITKFQKMENKFFLILFKCKNLCYNVEYSTIRENRIPFKK